jgi:DegT/DnrJ/EryC1/StrS aminotransferase family
VLFAYLFGVRYDISEIAKWCKERKIDVIEDVAQSFCGAERFNGNQYSTVTMFSMGLIKVQTAIYGGVTIVRDDEELHKKMKDIQDSYPAYTPSMLRKRYMTAMALYYFINTGRGNKAFLYAAKLSGKEREEFYVSLSRGFKPGESFIARFRMNPCAALVHFIYERIAAFDYKAFDENMRKY